ncbi:256_t:CDS:2 [Scutellospora calospora]|uniref:256_t:CDS:1 n=1 Tax=Scutellospora calospora TaxID=85575 RepID=A0ACA9KJD9_9GLOM|nr:256_t:CDS:2 [Scutellospora calospora]
MIKITYHNKVSSNQKLNFIKECLYCYYFPCQKKKKIESDNFTDLDSEDNFYNIDELFKDYTSDSDNQVIQETSTSLSLSSQNYYRKKKKLGSTIWPHFNTNTTARLRVPYRTPTRQAAKIMIMNKFKNKTLALTTDNESAIIVYGRLIVQELQDEFDNIRFSHYRCVAHILNLAAKKGLEMVDSLVGKVRNLMSKLRVSTCLCNDLRELCKLKGILFLKPELDIDTRWNSTYYMLQKIQKIEAALNLLVVDHPSIRLLYPNINEQQNL